MLHAGVRVTSDTIVVPGMRVARAGPCVGLPQTVMSHADVKVIPESYSSGQVTGWSGRLLIT